MWIGRRPNGRGRRSDVADQGQPQPAQIHLAGHQGLGHGLHARAVAAEPVQQVVFGGGFQVGALQHGVHAFRGANAVLLGDGHCAGAQGRVVGVQQVGETGADALVVGAAQGVFRQEVDVVAHHHNVPGFQVGVHPAGHVGDDQPFDAQVFHHPHRKSDLLHGPALVIVEAARHHHNRVAFQMAQHQFALVAFHGADRKMGDVPVRYFGDNGQFPRQGAQTRAQNNARGGLEIRNTANKSDGLLNLFV